MAKQLTRVALVVEYLRLIGMTEQIPSRSRKYREFRKQGDSRIYWVGRMGALRYGQNVTTSVSVHVNYERMAVRVLELRAGWEAAGAMLEAGRIL